MSMPFFTSLATSAYGPATNNGNGEPMSKARAIWWRLLSPSEAESSCTRRRPLSMGFLPNRSTRPRQNSAKTVSITNTRRPWRKSQTGLCGIRCGLPESRECNRPLRLGHVVTVHSLAANRQLLRIPPGRACFADVGAVVRAHLAAAEKGRTGHNYILGGTEASYAEIVQMVGKLLGQLTNTGVGRPPGIARRWPRLGMDIDDHGKEPRISAESAAIVSGNIICRS